MRRGERTEEEGRNSLRAVLSRLRGRLPDGALGGKGETRLWLEESVLTSDVRAFHRSLEDDRHREALDLYRGPFLEHFHLRGMDAFNRWADERRTHYRREAHGAALAVGAQAREAGELAEAANAYRRALDLAPLQEAGAAGLIRVLTARGERGDAVRFYQAFTDRLAEELDLSPSSELEALAEQIRSPATGVDGEEPAGEILRGGRTEMKHGPGGAAPDGF